MKKFTLLLSLSFLIFCTSCEEETTTPTETTPTIVRIDSLTVSNYPMDNGGYEWDNDILSTGEGNPDPYFIIRFGTEIVYESGYADNASGGPITYSIDPIELSPTNMYNFSLYDYDLLLTDEYMASFDSFFYDEDNGATESLTIQGSPMSIEMNLSYIY